MKALVLICVLSAIPHIEAEWAASIARGQAGLANGRAPSCRFEARDLTNYIDYQGFKVWLYGEAVRAAAGGGK